MKAKKAVNTKNNQPIVVVYGNTYLSRTQLKQLGFKWYGKDKVWFMPKTRFNDIILSSLNQMGVDTSELTLQKAQEGTPEPLREPLTEKPTQNPPEDNITDKTSGEYINSSYPINDNIFTSETKITIDGKDYPLIITFGRARQVGYDYGKKTMPFLTYEIKHRDIPDKVVMGGHYKPKDSNGNTGRWNKTRGPNYDEDGIVKSYLEAIVNDKTRLYHKIKKSIEIEEHLGARDPEFTDFLQTWENWKYDKEKQEELKQIINLNVPKRSVEILEPRYEGLYPIVFDLVAKTLYAKTGLDHPLAPSPANLASIPVDVEIQNIEQLNEIIDQVIEENRETITQKYLEYLKSFAFTQEEEEETRGQMQEVADLIINKNFNTDKIRLELMKRQFVRPRKKKNLAPGMVPEGEFKLIIDDKAIRNANFSKDNSPEYFWVAIAYNLMRIKNNNINFAPMWLDDAYRKVASIVSRYGYNVEPIEVARYIDIVARALYKDLTNRVYKNRYENMADFYGQSTEEKEKVPSHVPPAGVVDDWVDFVAKFNIDAETAKNRAQTVFRQLAKQLHPDVYKGLEGDKLFVELRRLYEILPDNLKQAVNWYKKVKIADL